MTAGKRRRSKHSTLVHLVAGGTGGTLGTVLTCPLEVLQTRLQSSGFRIVKTNFWLNVNGGSVLIGNASATAHAVSTFDGIWACFRHMIKNEGFQSLFRGVGANVVGVLPSRSLYFAVYSKTKDSLNHSGYVREESAPVHMASSAVAGFTTCTVTNPLWFVKTRLQLDTSRKSVKDIFFMIREVYGREGLPAFYRGLTASYAGISETVLNFVIYEHLKAKLRISRGDPSKFNLLDYIGASLISKSIASVIAYPHEVVRTRLRQQHLQEDGKRKYRSFLQTLRTVATEEGVGGLYGGMGTHVLRQIPNTCIMFAVYETVVHLLT